MSIVEFILQFAVHGIPLIAFPVALVWGLKPVVYTLVLLACAMLVGPYLFFGAWALIEGISLSDTIEQVRQTGIGMVLLAGYMMASSMVCALFAAAVRFAWTKWRAA
ncbi:hypothetical protein GCM10007385_26490 [Tateyamaria omphalii]|uniref:hypothetical protein n=1 Tax=Tateyamaria omphalii TaxID=299262 RepID=UPI00167A30D9|nr:hypothetical protein [Tateyamaria omphalii]GGX56467.1 hypothetical protein GCM10007385_26490 [Tateyamaria omphalii]